MGAAAFLLPRQNPAAQEESTWVNSLRLAGAKVDCDGETGAWRCLASDLPGAMRALSDHLGAKVRIKAAGSKVMFTVGDQPVQLILQHRS
jgi:hypothetical protein